jgi:hypothetical protein
VLTRCNRLSPNHQSDPGGPKDVKPKKRDWRKAKKEVGIRQTGLFSNHFGFTKYLTTPSRHGQEAGCRWSDEGALSGEGRADSWLERGTSNGTPLDVPLSSQLSVGPPFWYNGTQTCVQTKVAHSVATGRLRDKMCTDSITCNGENILTYQQGAHSLAAVSCFASICII